MASGYTEPPCDSAEVSRAFQQAEMSKDSTRKYECKPCCREIPQLPAFPLDLDHPADIQYVAREFVHPLYSIFNSFLTGFMPVSSLQNCCIAPKIGCFTYADEHHKQGVTALKKHLNRYNYNYYETHF